MEGEGITENCVAGIGTWRFLTASGALSSFSETLGCCPLGGEERLRERTQLGVGPNPPYQQKLNLNYAINSLSSNFFFPINPWYSLIVLLPSLTSLPSTLRALAMSKKSLLPFPQPTNLTRENPKTQGRGTYISKVSFIIRYRACNPKACCYSWPPGS